MSLSLLRRTNNSQKEQGESKQSLTASSSTTATTTASTEVNSTSTVESSNSSNSNKTNNNSSNKSTKSLMYAFKSLGCGSDRHYNHGSAAELASEEAKMTPQPMYYPLTPAVTPVSATTVNSTAEFGSNNSLLIGADRSSLMTEDTIGSSTTITTPISLAKSECSGINASYAAALDCELDCMADCDQLSFEIFGKYVYSRGTLDSSALTVSDVASTSSPSRDKSSSISSMSSFSSISSSKSGAVSASVHGTGGSVSSLAMDTSVAFEQRCVPFLDDLSTVCCVGDLLGKGTFGSVRKAQWIRGAFAGQCFALKVMPRHSENVGLDRKRRRQFVSEVRCLTALSYKHCGIVGYMTCMMDKDNYYLCTRLASMNLWDLIFQSKNQCLSMDITISIVRAVLQTLCFMHDHHWAHSDIKPDNVVLLETYPFSVPIGASDHESVTGIKEPIAAATEEKTAHQRGLPPTVTVQLVDFGMAAYVEDERLLYKERGGTLEYLSPERLNQRVSGADLKKSDVWSVGVLALELLMGRWLFDSKAEGKSAVKQCIRRGDWMSHTRESVKRELGTQGRHFLDLAFNPDSKRRLSAKDILSHSWLEE